MGAVALAVLGAVAVLDEAVAGSDPTAQLGMGRAHAGVDDVHLHTGAVATVGVGAVHRQAALVDAVEPPGGAGLVDRGTQHPVGFDGCHLRVGCQRRRLCGREVDGHAANGLAEHLAHLETPRTGLARLGVGHGAGLEGDEVAGCGGGSSGSDCGGNHGRDGERSAQNREHSAEHDEDCHTAHPHRPPKRCPTNSHRNATLRGKV